MTISTESIKSTVFSGNGSTTDFAISFKTFTQGDLEVTLTSAAGVEAVKTLTTNYTVSLNSNQDSSPGGTVTMVVAPASGEKLVIVNEPTFTQGSDIVNGGGFFPNVIEDMVDRTTVLSNRAHELTSRSIQIPVSDSTGTAVQLPTETLRANKAIVFSSTGSIGVSVDNYVDQVGAVAASATAAASSATAAASSETSSASSAAAAAASYDSFDDRYLGAKTSDPTLDNDSNALIDGALFFRTDQSVMKVYDLSTTTWLNTTPSSTDQGHINTVSGIAADVTAVAGKATEVGRLGTAAAVADMAILGTADVVVDMNVLATADVVSDMNVLGTADVVTDMNVLATADVVTDMNVLATADVVVDMNVLGTSANVTAMNTLGTSANVTAMSTVSGAIANVNTTATNIASVNNFAEVYRIAAADPGSSLTEGDLVFRTDTDTMRVYNGSAWQNVAPISTAMAFGTVVVAGQSNVVADSTSDTMTLVGSGATSITTNAGTDTVTISSTAGASVGLVLALG